MGTRSCPETTAARAGKCYICSMFESRNARANAAGHWIGLLLLVAMTSRADDAKDDLTLHGTVVDAATGLPVADADVRHLSLAARYSTNYRDESPPGWSASTDGEGHFTLADLPSRDSLPPGLGGWLCRLGRHSRPARHKPTRHPLGTRGDD